MPKITTRQGLIDYCLRKLGAPVIEINVDDDQLEDRICDAFQWFEDYHFDATERVATTHQITSADVANKYITVPERHIVINRVLPISQRAIDMFDVRYQIALQDFYNFSSHATFIHYDMVQRHLALVEFLFRQEKSFQHTRHSNKLFINMDWQNEVKVGDYIAFDSFATLDPADVPAIYDDRWLKMIATEFIRQQWGANLMKYDGISLPGGIKLNGQEIYEKATANIEKIMDDYQTDYQEPVSFMIG